MQMCTLSRIHIDFEAHVAAVEFEIDHASIRGEPLSFTNRQEAGRSQISAYRAEMFVLR